MNLQELYQFMTAQRLGVVSSLGPDGTPQSALVGIAVSPALDIIFDTTQDTRKYRNLCSRSVCSVVLGWNGEQTVQMEGVARQPTGADLESCLAVYFEAWPDGQDRLRWPGLVHLAISPRWIRFSDYKLNPPRVEEMTFPPSANVIS